MSETRTIHLNVPVLTRVEGEGALDIRIENGNIEHLQLKIFEPPRYFEKFLEGRQPQDVIDIVARICGICPVAYQMSAVQAIESAAGVEVSQWTKDMRRVMYCGEWLQSHSLHIHLLALPDYLGFSNVAEMAAKYPDEVKRGLSLQSL
ncbi:MAG: nickel-dependent hydrogenase large subunit, partial [Gammaproteobacteria bacterium]|nr:nickel-dependent hydrogenase large subunit [Gammaproteobacteria bacterium]